MNYVCTISSLHLQFEKNYHSVYDKRVCKIATNVVSCCFYRVVEFASYSDLKNALEKLSGKEMNGRKIKLIEAAKKR